MSNVLVLFGLWYFKVDLTYSLNNFVIQNYFIFILVNSNASIFTTLILICISFVQKYVIIQRFQNWEYDKAFESVSLLHNIFNWDSSP